MKIQNVEILGPRLIGLCGLAGSGKSAVAAILERHGYTRLAFAAPLKSMLQSLLLDAGVPFDEVPRYTHEDLKEAPLDVLGGVSARHAMQTLGTEWGRGCIAGDLWVGITMAKADALLAAGKRVVIEDVRFANEAAAVHGCELDHMHGIREVWRVEGRGGITGGHASEGQYLGHDLALDNSGTPEALEAQILAAILG